MKALRAVAEIIWILSLGISVPVYGQWSEPQPVEGINFGRTDWSPSINADGTKLYFASTRSNNEDLYVSERVNGLWTTPVNLGPPVN
jgi:hypothetical protein